MKAYILKEEDFDRLFLMVNEDPAIGSALPPKEKDAHDAAHRFFNFRVRRWADSVRTP